MLAGIVEEGIARSPARQLGRRNVRIDRRWTVGDINRIRASAQELVGLKPDIILTGTTAPTVAVQRETRTIPIVFVGVPDPVVSGIVARLNQPGRSRHPSRSARRGAVSSIP
jgi:ABC-type uncharacterized transport system substrate-binding protein